LPGGASYGVLVFPDHDPLSGEKLTYPAVMENKITQLRKQGAVIVRGPYKESSFAPLGIEKDFIATEDHKPAAGIAWTHRRDEAADVDIYFISNQQNRQRDIELSLRTAFKRPELYDPVTGSTQKTMYWKYRAFRTSFPVRLPANGSLFIILKDKVPTMAGAGLNWPEATAEATLNGPWSVTFDTSHGGPVHPVQMVSLQDWTAMANDSIRYYSGTASYTQSFHWTKTIGEDEKILLNVGQVNNLAGVTLNGIDCGVIWTAPYEVDITKALRPGKNELIIHVTNTWFNRLAGDLSLPVDKRRTWTTAPLRMKDKPLKPAGLVGPVVIMRKVK
jgi:hypothetical protein